LFFSANQTSEEQFSELDKCKLLTKFIRNAELLITTIAALQSLYQSS